MSLDSKIAVFPGSFDPYTVGHHDIIQRAQKVFDKIIIGIGQNKNKKTGRYFEATLIKNKIADLYKNNDKIEVEIFNTLTGQFARQKNAGVLIRGLRNTTDFEYENAIAQANSFVNPNIETCFFITDPALAYISSSLVRELHSFGHSVAPYVPFQL